MAALLAVSLVSGAVLGFRLAGGGPPATAAFADPSVGFQGLRPVAWTITSRAGGVAVTSPDRSGLVEIAAPAPATQASALLGATVAAIDRSYAGVQVQARTARRLDGLAAQVIVLGARNRAGVPLRILVAAAPGRTVAYLLEVFATTAAPASTLRAAQAVINSLRFTR